VKVELEPVRGMRDILEPESKYLDFIIKTFKNVAELYGYEYVVPPTIERFKLFAIKSGPEIERSMYVFKDKAGREVCLRPEFTAGIARLYLRHLLAKPKPIKLYYMGQVFRYEEPQYGRYREFFQAGVEYLGDSSIYADIEQILLLRDFYKLLGLSNYRVKIGTIALIRGLLSKWNVPEDEQDLVIHYIDKKMFDEVKKVLRKYEKSNEELLNKLMSFTAEDPSKLIEFGREIGLSQFGKEFNDELMRISTILRVCKEVGIKDVFVDLGFARGLAYYTGFIFEIVVPDLNLSIAGGGRYDKLIELYGGPSTPAVGFSIGVDRTMLTLIKRRVELPKRLRKVMLIAFTDNYVIVDEVASKLRSTGDYSVMVKFTTKSKLGDAIGLASRKGFDYVVIIGPKEVSEGVVNIKNLHTKEQKSIKLDILDQGIPI